VAERPDLDVDDVRRLLGGLVHDLRSPLAALMTNLACARRLVPDDDASGELDEVLAESVVACEALRHLIANLEVLARREPTPRSLAANDISQLVTEVVSRGRARAALAGVELAWQAVPTRQRRGGDRALLGLVLENAICDALRGAARGTQITVSVEESPTETTVRVEAPAGVGAAPGRPSEPENLSRTSGTPTGAEEPRCATGLTVSQLGAALGGFELTVDDAQRSVVLSLRGDVFSAG